MSCNVSPLRAYRILFFATACLLVAIAAQPARAVIVAGAMGGGNTPNNTTAAQLEALPTVTDGSFFLNVFQAGVGNAVYIGYKNTVDGPVGYALSGMHLGSISSVSIQSQTYQVVNRISMDGSDLALFVLTQADDIMPTLSALPLSSTAISDNTPVIMIGGGRNRIQDATTDADTPDSVPVGSYEGYTTSSTRLMRWGTNDTSNFAAPPGPTNTFDIGGRDTVVFRTVFDKPLSGDWLTTNQAQGVNNDSGGGVFFHDGVLAGIMVAVQTLDGNPNNALFGNRTLITDIDTYKSAIDAETGGMLIPEPQTALLLLLASAGLAFHRRLRR